jgi:anti-anti-sigma regulatory factor
LENRARPKDATAKAVNASLILENFDEAVNTTLQILREGSGCDLINILENFFDIIQQLKLDFSSLHLYDSLCAHLLLRSAAASERI